MKIGVIAFLYVYLLYCIVLIILENHNNSIRRLFYVIIFLRSVSVEK